MFKSSHKVFIIKYHIVIVCKYRKDLFLNEPYMEFLTNTLTEISKRYSVVYETIGVDEDHVHLLVQSVPRYSPSKIMQLTKSITAREIFARFPEIKEQLWGGEFWSDGGYIGTVGEGPNAEIVRRYIVKQGRNPDQLRLTEFTA